MDNADNRFYREATADLADESQFESWLSTHPVSDVRGAKLPLYHKQDMRCAYVAGQREQRAALAEIAELESLTATPMTTATNHPIAQSLRDIAHGMNATANQATLRAAAELIDRLATDARDSQQVAECVLLLHLMLEAPTTQISVAWKNAIRPALLAFKT